MVTANAMFDVDQYLAVGTDAGIYFVLAIASTLVYLVKLGLGFVGGADGIDIGVDDVDGAMDSTEAFSLFSVLSVLAFLMGVGWMGLVTRMTWGMGTILSGLLATGFGAALLVGTSGMMYGIRRMAHTPRYLARSALGRTAKVYLTIPPKARGQGQIEVTVSGRRRIMAAVTSGEEIPAFTAVRIVDVRKGDVFVVESAEVPRAKPGRARSRYI